MERNASMLSAKKWWEMVPQLVSDCAPHLIDVGSRLGAIPASSASAERVWSALGSIHSKKRNRLSNEKLEKLDAVYINLRSLNRQTKRRRVDILKHVVPGMLQSSDEELSSEDAT